MSLKNGVHDSLLYWNKAVDALNTLKNLNSSVPLNRLCSCYGAIEIVKFIIIIIIIYYY